MVRPIRAIERPTFGIDASGRMIRTLPNRRLFYEFELMGVRLHAELDPAKDGRRPDLIVRARLGSLPFTAEHPANRRAIAAILSAARSGLARAQLTVAPDRSIQLEALEAVDVPITPVTVVTATAVVALTIMPYFELLSAYVPDWPRNGRLRAGASPQVATHAQSDRRPGRSAYRTASASPGEGD